MTDSIDGVGGIDSTSAGSSQFLQARKDAMNAVAGELGMSSTDLRTAMAGGQSLEQIAASKGVSSTDLQSTIETSLKKDLPNASSAQISGMAARMVSGAHGHHGGGHHHVASAGNSSSDAGADGSTDGNDLGGSVSVKL